MTEQKLLEIITNGMRTASLSPIQTIILRLLGAEPVPRRYLVEYLGMPRTTVYDNLMKLQAQKLVEKFSVNNKKRGRPVVYWKLTEERE